MIKVFNGGGFFQKLFQIQ